jgi:hypothetical protein
MLSMAKLLPLLAASASSSSSVEVAFFGEAL